MKKSVSFLLLLGITIIALQVAIPKASANEDWPASHWTNEKSYFEKSLHKLGFGLYNVTSAWMEIFVEPHRHSNPFEGLAIGFGKAVTNTIGGAIQIVTFPLTTDAPLPEGGARFDV